MNVELLIAYGYQLYNTLRAVHLTTDKHSVHQATDSVSTDLLGLLDRLSEAYLGECPDCSRELLDAMIGIPLIEQEATENLENYVSILIQHMEEIEGSEDILNIVYDISLLCKKLLYLLRLD